MVAAAVMTACSVVSAGAVCAPCAVMVSGADEQLESSVERSDNPEEATDVPDGFAVVDGESSSAESAVGTAEDNGDESVTAALSGTTNCLKGTEAAGSESETRNIEGNEAGAGEEKNENEGTEEASDLLVEEESGNGGAGAEPKELSEQTAEPEVADRMVLFLSLQPVKKYGEKDPDLTAMIREQLHGQLADEEQERIAVGYLHVRYAGAAGDEGRKREPGQSAIEVEMEENPYWYLTAEDGESYLITIPDVPAEASSAGVPSAGFSADGQEDTSGISAESVRAEDVEENGKGEGNDTPDKYPDNPLCGGMDPKDLEQRREYVSDEEPDLSAAGETGGNMENAASFTGDLSVKQEKDWPLSADHRANPGKDASSSGNHMVKAEVVSSAGGKSSAENRARSTVIPGIVNGRVYRGKIRSVLELAGEDGGDCTVTLTRSGSGGANEDVTDSFVRRSEKNGKIETVLENPQRSRENDGAYTLSVKYRDEDGKEAEKKVSFSLNRFGSVYEFGDRLQHLDGAVVKKIGKSLRLSEYNPGALVMNACRLEITRDGRPLKGDGFCVRDMGVQRALFARGLRGWHRYDYLISGKNFRKEGIYQLVISSRDGSGNQQDSLRPGARRIRFCVDRTAPVIDVVEGLEKRQIKEDGKVHVEVSDAVGLRNIRIYADDRLVREEKNIDGKNSCKTEFTLKEGEHHIRITATDLAGNRIDTDEKAADGSYTFCPDYPFQRQISVGEQEAAGRKGGTGGFLGGLWKMTSGIRSLVHKWLSA